MQLFVFAVKTYISVSAFVKLIFLILFVFLEQTIYAHRFTNLTGENLTNISLFEDHCGNLLYDLISLSVKKYSKVLQFYSILW